jgi:hypothetical protein
MITVQIKDIQQILGVSYMTARRRRRLYLDILGREVKEITVFDLMRLTDLPLAYILEKCPHLGSKVLQSVHFSSKTFRA